MTQYEEDKILDLLAAGNTAEQIAKELCISPRTVHWKLQVLYGMYRIPAGKNRNIKLLNALGYINRKSRPEEMKGGSTQAG